MIDAVPALLEVAWHTLAIYFFLILGLRLLGLRQMGQLTPVDLIIVIILGSAVETAMVAGNTSLAAGLVSATTLLAANRLLTELFLRYKRLRHLVVGGPTLLVHFGHFVESHLRRVGLTEADVLQAIRERGEAGVEQVKFAVLEVDGSINIVPMHAATHRHDTPVRPPAPPRAVDATC